MKNTKKDYYNKEILKCLLDQDVVSTQYIAQAVGLSEKSVRNKMDDLNTYLKENHLGFINKKPRVGIWLECDESQRQKLQSSLVISTPVNVMGDDQERVYEVLKVLFKLRPWELVTTHRLSEELYLSAPTVLKVIRQCETWLKPYHIRIINERNRGYRLEYHENEYRVAFKDLIMENPKNIKQNLETFFYNIDTKLIQKSIIETENEWNYRFTDDSFYEIFIYCCIAYQRKDIQIPFIKGGDEYELLQKYNEYAFTVAIFKKLQDKFHILFSNEDLLFLSVQIMCSKFIGISQANETLEQVKKYDNKLIEFVNIFLQVVGNILDVDLSNDQKLKESLIFHLRPTIFRLRHGSFQTNSLINFIKTEYKNVFRATWSISIMFEEYYGVQLTEDEVGYLVLYIQSALERKNRPLSLVLVIDSNRGHAELVCQRVRKMIPEITKIEIMSSHDFKLYGHKEADIIVAPRDMDSKDPRIVVIPNLLSESGILRLRNKLDSKEFHQKEAFCSFSPMCIPLLDPELIFVNQKCKDKETLLKFMSTAMEMRGYVTNHFFETVMEREQATTTSIGSGIALTHGAHSEVIESKMAIAILEEPIPWHEDKVDVVFLLGFKMTTPDEIKRVQTFYKDYISFIEQEENLKKIKECQTNIELYKYLIK